MLTYERRFVLEACHFNSQATYDTYALAVGPMGAEAAQQGLLEVLKDIHGHNFEVTVVGKVESDFATVVIWDEQLADIVNEWNRTNLSVHPDFKGKRATTEVMALLLKSKLENKWPDVKWTVEVRENRDIAAVAS